MKLIKKTLDMDDGLVAHYEEFLDCDTVEITITKLTLGGMIVKMTHDLVEEAEAMAYSQAFLDTL